VNDRTEESRGLLAWFAKNHVAANLLMMMILVGGSLPGRIARRG